MNSSSLPLLHIMVDERESWCRLMRPSHGDEFYQLLGLAALSVVNTLLLLLLLLPLRIGDDAIPILASTARRRAPIAHIFSSCLVIFVVEMFQLYMITESDGVTYAVRHSHKDEILTHNSRRRRGPPPSMRVVECYSFTVCTVLPRFFFFEFYIRSRFFLRTTRRAV